jgi:hypothetical protein
MMRRYHPYWMRFAQADPWDGSYDLAGPQSFNRYSYTHNDPVNFTDPAGLLMTGPNDDYVIPASRNGWGQTYAVNPFQWHENMLGRGWRFNDGVAWVEFTFIRFAHGPTRRTHSGLSEQERRQRFLDCIRENERWYNNIAHNSASEFYDPRLWISAAGTIAGLWQARSATSLVAATKIVGRSLAKAVPFEIAARTGKFIGTGIGTVSGRNRLFRHCQQLWNVFDIRQPTINPNFTPR